MLPLVVAVIRAAIFEQLSSKGKLIVFDQDPDAKANAWEAPNFHFVAANFAFLKKPFTCDGNSGS